MRFVGLNTIPADLMVEIQRCVYYDAIKNKLQQYVAKKGILWKISQILS